MVDDVRVSVVFVGLVEMIVDEIWIGLDCWWRIEDDMELMEKDCSGLDLCLGIEDEMVLIEKVCIGLDCCKRVEDDLLFLRLDVVYWFMVCVRGV